METENVEEILQQEIEDLKRQQYALERELQSMDELSCHMHRNGLVDVSMLQSSLGTAVPVPTTAAVVGGNTNTDNNTTTNNNTDASRVSAAGYDDVSLRERMTQLENLRRRYQRDASRAMRRYFKAVSDYPEHQARREKRLSTARPFTFEGRELQKEQRIRTRRLEEERLQREQALQQTLHFRFRANPVPPSTYMNKYDLMVEEWRQRRAAVEALAIEKAELMKAETEFVQLSAESMRQVREIMGVRREKKSVADDTANCRRVVGLREVPLEVKMKLWLALEEHEQVRNERIKQRAVERLKALREEETHRLSPAENALHPQQQQQQHQMFLMGSMPPPAVPVGGPIERMPAPQTSPQLIMVGNVPTPEAAAASSPLMTGVVSDGKGTISATTQQQQQRKKRDEGSKRGVRNSNMTFRPKIRGGVPDFDTMWAEDRVALAERKRKQQPTEVQPFNLTASAKEKVVRGRSVLPSKRFMSAPRAGQQRCRSAAVDSEKSSKQATAPQPGENEKKIVPKGTRAHAVRTQAVFMKYINTAEKDGTGGSGRSDAAALREGVERQKIVNARLKEYLKGTSCDVDDVIKKKVRALRQRNREIEREFAEKLEEMRLRVAQMPPIFVEPTHLHDIAKARVETEKEIMQMLKDTGVDDSTLAAILSGDSKAGPDNNTSAAEMNLAAVPTNEGEAEKVESSTKQMKEEETVRKKDDTYSSSFSSSSSSDTGSEAGSSKALPQKEKNDYDDDFEGSSDSSSSSV